MQLSDAFGAAFKGSVGAILFAQSTQNAAKLIRRCLTMQTDNDPLLQIFDPAR